MIVGYPAGAETVPEEVRDPILVLSATFVLFTLTVNALSMAPLMVKLGLDRPSAVDRFALAYAELERAEEVGKVIARLEKEGAVLPQVMEELRGSRHEREEKAQASLDGLREEIMRWAPAVTRITVVATKGVAS